MPRQWSEVRADLTAQVMETTACFFCKKAPRLMPDVLAIVVERELAASVEAVSEVAPKAVAVSFRRLNAATALNRAKIPFHSARKKH